MHHPAPRGPLSSALLDLLWAAPSDVAARPFLLPQAHRAVREPADVVRDDDAQISLFLLYALHYRGLDGVSEDWEWDGDLLRLRAVLEGAFEAELRSRIPVPAVDAATGDELAAALFALAAADDGPALSSYVSRRATRGQVEEFLKQRSVYHLTEADPHSWAIPRLTGRPKAALVEIQADEYGSGVAGRMHAELFASTLKAAGLDPAYGRYVDEVPAITLASMNMMSMFGLHRRLRGAVTGHLAAFEMTSSLPNRRYASGFRRLGFTDSAVEYFDEHVLADAVHEQVAARDLAGALAEDEPALREDVLWGAAACLAVDGWVGAHLLGSWQRGSSSLRATTTLERTA